MLFNLIAHEQKYLQLRMNGVFKDPNVIPSANWCEEKDWESIKFLILHLRETN